MELIATSRREGQPVACAYGAALEEEGRALRCELLFVMRGQTRRTLVFRCPTTKERVRVRLPKKLLGARRHGLTFDAVLEVAP
ncbi:hypothetical protein DAETH_28950 [Deinococcus aetherius]|uniref:Uncharacterized protein n=1 Tax=Deinococcus aetherius TaxID=200252 RepID=A0ABM8AGK4_9DEIO|nr:hypothetical protein [Deinococcus aetherius]BDP42926.1 hypothetical protein DAETH_28950 [Deinococcus aetherius]